MVWGWDESHGLKPKKYQTDLCQMLTCAAVRVKREQACGYGKLALPGRLICLVFSSALRWDATRHADLSSSLRYKMPVTERRLQTSP